MAGSGNPQRLPPSRESGSRACGSPQSPESQLRSQISLSMQSPVNTLDMARADDYFSTKDWKVWRSDSSSVQSDARTGPPTARSSTQEPQMTRITARRSGRRWRFLWLQRAAQGLAALAGLWYRFSVSTVRPSSRQLHAVVCHQASGSHSA